MLDPGVHPFVVHLVVLQVVAPVGVPLRVQPRHHVVQLRLYLVLLDVALLVRHVLRPVLRPELQDGLPGRHPTGGHWPEQCVPRVVAQHVRPVTPRTFLRRALPRLLVVPVQQVVLRLHVVRLVAVFRLRPLVQTFLVRRV